MSEKTRRWTVPDNVRDQFATQQFVPLEQGELEQAYLEAGVVQHRIGGTVNVAPIRVEPAPGQWVVIGLTFQWESFVPGVSHTELQSAYGEPEPDDLNGTEEEAALDGEPVNA